MLLVKGKVARFGRQGNAGDVPVRQTELASLAVASVEPEWAELLRAGRCFAGGITTFAAGIATDTAMPTTAPKLSLVNNETGPSQKCYIVYHVSAMLSSGTAAAGGSLGFALSDGAMASQQVAASANTKVTSLSQASKHNSKAAFNTGITLAGTPYWSYYRSDNSLLATTSIGQGIGVHNLERPICIIQPGYALGLSVQSGAGTSPLFVVTVWWAELELDLE